MTAAPRPSGHESWLTIDRGNSTLDCALHTAGATLRVRLPPLQPERVRDLLLNQRPSAVMGASVVYGGLDAVAEVLARMGLDLQIAGRDQPCPLKLAYPDPTQLGVDRWLSALAAHRMHGAALVVDCGTATTVNAVSASGVFLGGAIGPGVQAMQEALLQSAPRLPRVHLDPSLLRVPAVTTEDAVRAGVLLSAAGGIQRLSDELAAAPGLEDAVRLLTGGNAGLLAPVLPGFTYVDDLVHQGLRWLLTLSSSRS